MGRDNTVSVTIGLVKKLGIPVTLQAIVEELEIHPDPGTLLAISDALDRFHIPNEAFKVHVDELIKIPRPFIVYLTYQSGNFALLTHIDKEKVVISSESFPTRTVSREEFAKIYNGTVLIAEAATESGEKDYRKKRQQEILDKLRIPFVIASLFLLLIAALLNSGFIPSLNPHIILLLFFKSAGLATSILLLIQSIDTSNPLVQRFCTAGKKADCNRILSSPAAKINSVLSWSEVGFFYFSGTWMALLFNSNSFILIQVLGVLNVLGLPYTIYSFYYQASVAKAWCLLCCTVQIVLWLEFFAFLPHILHPFALPRMADLTSLLIAMGIPIIIWVFIKPYLLQTQQVRPLTLQLRKFKYNSDLFRKLLNEQPIHAIPNEEHSIVLGNRKAEHIITMVANLYCQPCSRAHQMLDQWISEREDVRLQIIFQANSEGDKAEIVARHLISLKALQDDKILKQALHDWYNQRNKNYDYWANMYPVTENKSSGEILEKQREWCRITDVKVTPAIFIDGRMLPQFYQVEDLKYVI